MNFTEADFIQKLDQFCDSINKGILVYWKNMNFTNLTPNKVQAVSQGKKYIKLAICREDNSGKLSPSSVYCFVDKTNGDILKGTWKAPVANGVRGNIFSADVLDKVTVYGTAYLVGGASQTIASLLK